MESRWTHDDAMAARERAARDIREDFERQSSTLPVRLARFVGHLSRHLFDPQLTVQACIDAAGVQHRNITSHFVRAYGRPARTVIEQSRLTVVRRLLERTDMPVGQICEVCGFGSRRTLNRVFREQLGESPGAYRRRPALAAKAGTRDQAQAALRRALDGQASPTEAEALIERLSQRYGFELGPGAGSERGGDEADTARCSTAELVWSLLDGRPFANQEATVAGLAHRVPGLLTLLRDKSRSEGRGDRDRGIAIARLALASLDVFPGESIDAKRLAGRRARAWAWIGNAQRLALDFPAAERSFEEALSLAGQRNMSLAVRAEVSFLLAALRWYQTRFESARVLLGKAIRIYRKIGDQIGLAQSLLLMAQVLLDGGRVGNTHQIEEALTLLIEIPSQSRLKVVGLQLLAWCEIERNRPARVEGILRQAEEICDQEHIEGMTAFHNWSRGRAAAKQARSREAEVVLRRSVRDFGRKQEYYYQSCAALDLALTQLDRDRPEQAIDTIRPIIPLLDSLSVARLSMAARTLVRQAANRQRLEASLQSLAREMHLLRHDPVKLQKLRAGLG